MNTKNTTGVLKLKLMKKICAATVLLLSFSVCSFGQDKEQVIALLYDIDENRTKDGDEIIYIEETTTEFPASGLPQ